MLRLMVEATMNNVTTLHCVIDFTPNKLLVFLKQSTVKAEHRGAGDA